MNNPGQQQVRHSQNSFTKGALSPIAMPGISPFVETSGTAVLVNSFPFKKLCLDAGLPLTNLKLIETRPAQ
jgi:hypothetical protein